MEVLWQKKYIYIFFSRQVTHFSRVVGDSVDFYNIKEQPVLPDKGITGFGQQDFKFVAHWQLPRASLPKSDPEQDEAGTVNG